MEGNQFYSWPLWYLMSITYSFIIFLIVNKFTKSDKYHVFFATFILIILFSINFLINHNFYGMFNESLTSSITKVYTDRPLIGYIYLIIGLIICKNNAIIHKIKASYIFMLFIIFFILHFFSIETSLDYILVIICSTLFFIWIIRLSYNTQNKSILVFDSRILKEMSIVIYYTHMIYFFIWGIVNNSISQNGNLLCYIIVIVYCVLTYFVVKKNNKNMFIKKIFF